MIIYEPGDDSFMLSKHVQKHAKGRVLDIGTGSGIQAVTAARLSRVKSVIGVDIQKSVIQHCKSAVKGKEAKKIRFKQSDLFSNIKGSFDTITFNPPYLPGDVKLKDITVDGGKKGYEVLARFFSRVSEYLNPEGIILIVFSSLTNKEKVNEIIENNMLEYTELDKKGIFMEELYVYLVKKSDILQMLEKNGIKNIIRFAKGHRGIILTGTHGKKKIAVKMQRKDIGAYGTVEREANILVFLNKHHIGPKIIFSAKDMFVYKFIEGIFIPEFLEKASKKPSKKDLIKVIVDVLKQCYKLDQLGINKEEMHHPYKHIVVTKAKKPVMLDFERAKKTENPHNVTQFCQYLTSSVFNSLTLNRLGIDADKLRNLAKEYKKDTSLKNFRNILQMIA
ncbi:HemK2/MTQ2 family protein methyltransferase [Thermoproteota archaeon]